MVIHDTKPGGIGISHAAFKMVTMVVKTALLFVAECPCTAGCPKCIHDFHCEEYNVRLDKAAALEILQVRGVGSGCGSWCCGEARKRDDAKKGQEYCALGTGHWALILGCFLLVSKGRQPTDTGARPSRPAHARRLARQPTQS
jgi:hypothetical protein